MSTNDLVVCKNFKLIKKLGTGAFGQIYLAQNRTNPSQKYAAKLQDASSKYPQLCLQAKLYKYLTSSGNVTGIPKVYAMTTQGKYNIMLMDLLGKSLQDHFVQQQKRFSLKTTLMIVKQMIDRIQYLHEKQIIHRDIKPDNFLMGINNKKHLVYVVDLGLSKKYMKDNQHIPYKQGKQLTGTARYASINTHQGIQQSRRDDIQSIAYVMMYFLKGILPWQNMKAKDTKTKYNMIMQKKKSTPAEVLCKGFPTELATFINYAKSLKFQQKPDYDYLRSLLNSAKKNSKIQMNYIYDWTQTAQDKIAAKQAMQKQSQSKLQENNEKKLLYTSSKRQIQSLNKPSTVLGNASNKFTQPNTNIQSKIQQNKITTQNSQNVNNVKMKAKTNTISGLNQPTTNKISGPKITVIKR